MKVNYIAAPIGEWDWIRGRRRLLLASLVYYYHLQLFICAGTGIGSGWEFYGSRLFFFSFFCFCFVSFFFAVSGNRGLSILGGIDSIACKLLFTFLLASYMWE